MPKRKKQQEESGSGVVLRGARGDTVLTPGMLEDWYAEACRISRASRHASCHEWMPRMGISYGTAVALMDMMERRGFVKPPSKRPAGEDSGPRKLA
jgi:hypothetical protein